MTATATPARRYRAAPRTGTRAGRSSRKDHFRPPGHPMAVAVHSVGHSRHGRPRYWSRVVRYRRTRPPRAPARRAAEGRRPARNCWSLTLPWVTLHRRFRRTGHPRPHRAGHRTRGPRRLASLALLGSGTEWRIILTDADRRAMAVARLPRTRQPAGSQTPGLTSVIGRVTIILPERRPRHPRPPPAPGSPTASTPAFSPPPAAPATRPASKPTPTVTHPAAVPTPPPRRPTGHRPESASTSPPATRPAAAPAAGSLPGAATSTTPCHSIRAG